MNYPVIGCCNSTYKERWLNMDGMCKLCLNMAKLCNSHVIPEFCYNPLYDNKHRALTINADGLKQKYIQQGFRDFLLCRDCENNFSLFEKRFKEYWFDSGFIPKTIKNKIVTIEGYDYLDFKLFHLSVIWRMSVSEKEDFKSVSLGPYEEKLRKILFERSFVQEYKYPIHAEVLVDDDFNVCTQMIYPACRTKLHNKTVYYTTYAGCVWYCIVTEDELLQETALQTELPRYINQEGKLFMLVENYARSNPIQSFLKQSGEFLVDLKCRI